jgi:hypothetical protein
MQAVIEIANSGEKEVIATFPTDVVSPIEIQLDELSRLKISVTGYNESTRFLVGMLELKAYELLDRSTLMFARGDIPIEMLEKGDFFSQPFVNQIGRSTLSLEHNGDIFQIEVQLTSTKVKDGEVFGWLDKICEQFPVFELPSLMTPISEIGAAKEKQAGFRSLLSFIRDVSTLIGNVKTKIDTPRYLKTSYSRQASINGNLINRSAMFSQSWVRPGTRWKPVPSGSPTVIKKGLKSFEPEKYPSLNGFTSYSTDLNVEMLEALCELLDCCAQYRLSIKQRIFEIDELRTQFGGGNAAKFNLFHRYEEAIGSLEKLVNETILKLETLGTKRQKSVHRSGYDSRYRQLCTDIADINLCTRQLARYKDAPSTFLGIMGLDFIFEFFAFSQLISCLKRMGLELIEASDGFPLSSYLKFWHSQNKYGVRILYDFKVPKAHEKITNFPIWDYWENNTKLRPDFIVHFYTEDYEEVAIFDAKYKSSSKCRDDLNSFKPGESIVVKYGTKMFLAGENKKTPVYVGALCCETNWDESTPHIWMLRSDDTSNPLAQESGITTLSSTDSNELFHLISRIVDRFQLQLNSGPKYRTSETTPVHQQQTQSTKLIRKYKQGASNTHAPKQISNRRRKLTEEDRAKSINANDARLVKGMLQRGDIPQHIAQYFGVNNGRISDIKNGNTFATIVAAAPNELPPPGPYPSIEYLLKLKPEIESLF